MSFIYRTPTALRVDIIRREVGPCAAALAKKRFEHHEAVQHLNALERTLFFGHRLVWS